MPYQINTLSWLKAARIPSQTYIFLPLLLGEAIALHQGVDFDIWTMALVHLFGLAIQLYIVFANDYADQETDSHNETFTPFSGGSRVLVDGDLSPTEILNAAKLMALASTVTGGALSLKAGTPYPLLLAILGILLLWMYSYPPVKLSYRGGGEILQMIGVGIVLPLMGYTAFLGSLSFFPWEILLIILPTQLACAIGTAVPDAPSDDLDKKRTIPVLLGPTKSRKLVISLHSLTVLQIIWLSLSATSTPISALTLLFLASSIVGQLFFIKSKPGTNGVLAFTFLSILSTLTGMAILSHHFWA